MAFDCNGYEIRHVGGSANSHYKLFAPSGEFIRKYRHDNAANEGAERHYINSKTVITERPCMCCRITFSSTGIGHRLCDKCSTRSGGLI